MTILKRLFAKTPADPAPATREPEAAASAAPRPDTTARARDEEASVAHAIAAGDTAAIGQWVLDGSSTRVRQMAAEAVTDAGQLRDLIRAARGGNDKHVYRILTAKRDALHAAERLQQQRQAEIDATTAAISRHAERSYDALFEATLVQLTARWQAAAVHALPDLQRQVAGQIERARTTITQHHEAIAAEAERQRTVALAAEDARRQREAAAEAAAAAAAERARLQEAAREAERMQRAAEDEAIRSILGLLRQAQAALDHGGTARAVRLRETLAEKLPGAPALPPWFERRLQELDARLDELKDWKTFTVVPKRGELLQRMHSLIGADMAPEELARQIRKLRDEWRTLHRGAGEDPSPEWQEFDAAANRAYEPCREHFARQAVLRKENQAHREALLERLASFIAAQDGEEPNWRAVQQVAVEARREWQGYAPVDQHAVKPLQARFRALLDDLHGRLDAEYTRNIEAKRKLIAHASELVKLEDTRQAIDEARNLQRAWKAIGIVPWSQGNTLWDEFRRHCDAVFQRSSQEYAAHGVALEGNQARAIALCDELEQLAVLSGEPLLAGLQQLHERRAEFDSLELPRSSARDLRQRFARATDRCHEAMLRHRAAAARQSWLDLFAAAAQVRAYALATVQQHGAETCEALRASAETRVAELDQAPKGTRSLLEQQLTRIAAGSISTDLAANETALRMLCIRAELLADVPSPAEDLDLRREYQMQRLVASMGRGERPGPSGFEDLAREWLATGPVEAGTYDGLFARFERCRER
jgi:hypothetical protein